jgi:hypothetical protein
VSIAATLLVISSTRSGVGPLLIACWMRNRAVLHHTQNAWIAAALEAMILASLSGRRDEAINARQRTYHAVITTQTEQSCSPWPWPCRPADHHVADHRDGNRCPAAFQHDRRPRILSRRTVNGSVSRSPAPLQQRTGTGAGQAP